MISIEYLVVYKCIFKHCKVFYKTQLGFKKHLYETNHEVQMGDEKIFKCFLYVCNFYTTDSISFFEHCDAQHPDLKSEFIEMFRHIHTKTKPTTIHNEEFQKSKLTIPTISFSQLVKREWKYPHLENLLSEFFLHETYKITVDNPPFITKEPKDLHTFCPIPGCIRNKTHFSTVASYAYHIKNTYHSFASFYQTLNKSKSYDQVRKEILLELDVEDNSRNEKVIDDEINTSHEELEEYLKAPISGEQTVKKPNRQYRNLNDLLNENNEIVGDFVDQTTPFALVGYFSHIFVKPDMALPFLFNLDRPSKSSDDNIVDIAYDMPTMTDRPVDINRRRDRLERHEENTFAQMPSFDFSKIYDFDLEIIMSKKICQFVLVNMCEREFSMDIKNKKTCIVFFSIDFDELLRIDCEGYIRYAEYANNILYVHLSTGLTMKLENINNVHKPNHQIEYVEERRFYRMLVRKRYHRENDYLIKITTYHNRSIRHICAEGDLFFIADMYNLIFLYYKGVIHSEFQYGSNINQLIFGNGKLYILSIDGRVDTLRVEENKLTVLSNILQYSGYTRIALYKGHLLGLNTFHGYLSSVTKGHCRYLANEYISYIDTENLYFGTSYGYVGALRSNSGKILIERVLQVFRTEDNELEEVDERMPIVFDRLTYVVGIFEGEKYISILLRCGLKFKLPKK